MFHLIWIIFYMLQLQNEKQIISIQVQFYHWFGIFDSNLNHFFSKKELFSVGRSFFPVCGISCNAESCYVLYILQNYTFAFWMFSSTIHIDFLLCMSENEWRISLSTQALEIGSTTRGYGSRRCHRRRCRCSSLLWRCRHRHHHICVLYMYRVLTTYAHQTIPLAFNETFLLSVRHSYLMVNNISIKRKENRSKSEPKP